MLNPAILPLICLGIFVLFWSSSNSDIIFFIVFFFFFFYDCVGSSLVRMGFLWLRRAGATLAVHGLLIAVASLVAEHRL